MNGKIRFGSVCSGIEAASVAWHPLGWEAAWLSEIEPFPCAVLKHHYPQVPNLGDMTLLPNRIASGEIEAPDVFCGGTPCQAFSVAGLRQSLDDSRGNLSLIFCEIANAIDNIRLIQQSSPAIIFWENVPGVLNTKDNAFGCFLAGLAGESDALIPSGGRWTDAGFIDGPKRAVAWRVLDAQYFGLAQRRKRVFVVASARDDFDPAEVLFEFDGVRRDIAPSGKKREKTSNGLENIVGTLCARDYKGLSADNVSEGKAIVQEVYENHPADSRVKEMGGHIDHVGGIMQQMAVRRLTPKECERLQGFPDGYTDIRPKGKDTPDGSRYKALGNSWAVPVVAWIGKRINNAIT